MKNENYESEVRSMLTTQPFFDHLEPEFTEFIVDSAVIEQYDTHSYLFYEGDPATNFYCILTGSIGIQVFAGERGFVDIQELGPGDLAGWSWLFPPYKWFFSGEVIEPIRVISFDAVALRKICEENNDFGFEMAMRSASLVVQRVSETRNKLVESMV